MNETKIGGTKKKITNILSMAVLLILFVAYMFPFVMVVINSLKQKRDIIKSPFSWLFTIKGLSFDNFVKAFTQMDFPRAFGNSLIVTVSATLLVTLFASMLAYYIVRHNNKISKLTFSLMVASMIIPFQAIMIPLVSIYGGTLNILNHRITLIFMHTGFSMAYAVFYKGGTLRIHDKIVVEMDAPGMLMVKYNDAGEILTLGVSDPTRFMKKLHLSVNQRIVGTAQENIQTEWDGKQALTRISVDLPQNEYAGKSVIYNK